MNLNHTRLPIPPRGHFSSKPEQFRAYTFAQEFLCASINSRRPGVSANPRDRGMKPFPKSRESGSLADFGGCVHWFIGERKRVISLGFHPAQFLRSAGAARTEADQLPG